MDDYWLIAGPYSSLARPVKFEPLTTPLVRAPDDVNG
jgi:hypothetical protein